MAPGKEVLVTFQLKLFLFLSLPLSLPAILVRETGSTQTS